MPRNRPKPALLRIICRQETAFLGLLSDSNASVLYVYAGKYIGKTGMWRESNGGSPGIARRLMIEHNVWRARPKSKEGRHLKYKEARAVADGSLTMYAARIDCKDIIHGQEILAINSEGLAANEKRQTKGKRKRGARGARRRKPDYQRHACRQREASLEAGTSSARNTPMKAWEGPLDSEIATRFVEEHKPRKERWNKRDSRNKSGK
jgi:hypothetical protein